MLDEQDRLRLQAHVARQEKTLFLLTFVAGAAGLIAAKLLGLGAWASITASVGALAVLAVGSWRLAHLAPGHDRSGDSVYYLGFLFTLVSLAYALWEFSRTPRVEAVVANFAVALVSTITGLVFRVLFQQLTEAPEDAERDARLELSEAVRRVGAELLVTVDDLSALRLRVRSELRDSLSDAVTDVVAQSEAAIRAQRDFVHATTDSVQAELALVREQAAASRGGNERLAQTLDALPARLEGLLSAADRLTGACVEVARQLDVSAANARDAATSLTRVAALRHPAPPATAAGHWSQTAATDRLTASPLHAAQS